MQIAAIMFLSFALSIVWALIIRRKENLSVKPLLYIFLFSFFAVLISILMQTIIYFLFQDFLKTKSYAYGILFDCFVHSSLPEEAVKALLFSIFVKLLWADKMKNMDEITPAQTRANIRILMLLSVFYGLIFASFENLAYVIRYPESIWLRSFTSNILHAGLGVYYLEISMVQKTRNIIRPFLFTWIIHGLYNMFFSIGSYFMIFGAVLVLFTVSNAVNRYDRFKSN
ncbi:protease PrsW [Treponema sp. OMZ 792]|uniref:protease PrsW n=1 Tax=unclassified Treponema TaxID=2638727 RepID=UPI0020A3600A|nr:MULTISPECIES: protease PrsW [unclassified Treponema]UTC74181.1 protease PrsW [Treponema sp. OMZ 792]UTC79089.1 protease PrsW [Treponema sp. OMZ 799]UTC80578.1 protease PrsW [Treponema sp. OMZ 798]